jgi:hypothetical protein
MAAFVLPFAGENLAQQWDGAVHHKRMARHRAGEQGFANSSVNWVKTTLNNGAARFTMDVWPGTGAREQGLPVHQAGDRPALHLSRS